MLGRSDRVLHETRAVDKGEGEERRGEALLGILQDPQQPRRHRRASPLLEPRRHRPRPRRTRRGSFLFISKLLSFHFILFRI